MPRIYLSICGRSQVRVPYGKTNTELSDMKPIERYRQKRAEQKMDEEFADWRLQKIQESYGTQQKGSAQEKVDEEGKLSDAPLSCFEHRLCDIKSLQKAYVSEKESVSRALLKDLMAVNGVKKLVQVPKDFRARCAALIDEFPQFEHAISNFILSELAISFASGKGLKFPSLCLQGEPGVGKTFFAGRFSEVFDLPFKRINLEGAQGGFVVTGLDRSYSNYHPGAIFRFLAAEATEFANGLIAFEEVDKARGDERYGLENSLLQVLEESTARAFVDQSMPDLKIDITPLNFCFTANSLKGISAPLLSRLTAIELEPLTKSQASQIGWTQFEKLINDLGLEVIGLRLDQSSIDSLGEFSPREQKQVLRSAVGRAILDETTSVVIPRKKSFAHKVGFI